MSNGNGSEQHKEKLKALQLTLDKIEKGYGKGTIMKLGDDAIEDVQVIPTGSLGLDLALGVGVIPAEGSLKYTDPNLRVKRPLPYMPLQKPRKVEELRRSSMQNMPLIAFMPRNWAWI